ncbi:hypothetical protein [Streptomyces sulfonofaciens]|uniref:hypothetical protein n=1 Tax=Streptomyces sulfonofaciens TaxID=68272 RepID=UPI001675F0AE|nr:hypothetical protein [Streptomyces sulfonofaciens]
MAGPGGEPGAEEPAEAGAPGFDEDAAWAAIVAGYGEEPPDPPGAKPFKPIEDLLLPEPEPGPGTADGGTGRRPGADAAEEAAEGGADGTDPGKPPRPGHPLGGSVAFAPGVGPRDYRPARPSGGEDEADDEGHFIPPEPPPLPAADTTARFGWLAVLGGPLLLLLSVLFGWQMTWWLATLGIGGFVGGFVTLVVRMNPGDEDDDDPGRGAVV